MLRQSNISVLCCPNSRLMNHRTIKMQEVYRSALLEWGFWSCSSTFIIPVPHSHAAVTLHKKIFTQTLEPCSFHNTSTWKMPLRIFLPSKIVSCFRGDQGFLSTDPALAHSSSLTDWLLSHFFLFCFRSLVFLNFFCCLGPRAVSSFLFFSLENRRKTSVKNTLDCHLAGKSLL